MKYRKKPVVIDATQWFMNGDHPCDFSDRGNAYDFSDRGNNRGAMPREGMIVRRYHSDKFRPKSACPECGAPRLNHGWIDTIESGHVVCPGDWIITGVQGERYPCKPDIFAATYEPATAPVAGHTTLQDDINMANADRDFEEA
jgi:hypothetical protein